ALRHTRVQFLPEHGSPEETGIMRTGAASCRRAYGSTALHNSTRCGLTAWTDTCRSLTRPRYRRPMSTNELKMWRVVPLCVLREDSQAYSKTTHRLISI